MQEKDLISVIVPVYNVEPYLAECVNSILNQTYKNFEVILVDDGSTDSSGEMCDRFAEKDLRVRVIHKKNGGLSSARNIGVGESKGEYICFVDSDDIISKDYLKILYENAVNFNVDVSMCGFVRFWDNKEFSPIDSGVSTKTDKYDLLDRLADVGTDESISVVISCNKLIRKKIAESISFPVGKLHEDEFYINSLMKNAESFAETSKQLYFYRQRSDSIVGKNNQGDIRHFDVVIAFKERVRLYKQICSKKLYQKMKKAYREIVKFQCKNFVKAKAIKTVL